MLSFYHLSLVIREAVEGIDEAIDVAVGFGDLGGDVVEGIFVDREVLVPLVLLGERELYLLLLQLRHKAREIQTIKGLQRPRHLHLRYIILQPLQEPRPLSLQISV